MLAFLSCPFYIDHAYSHPKFAKLMITCNPSVSRETTQWCAQTSL